MRILTRSLNRQTIYAASLGALVALCANRLFSVEPTTHADRIDELLRKRLALLEECERGVKERLRIDPQVRAVDVRRATVAVLNARLDLAKSSHDRLKVLEEMVKSAEEWDRLMAGLVDQNVYAKYEGLQAKVEIVEAQIALERFREHVKQPTGR